MHGRGTLRHVLGAILAALCLSLFLLPSAQAAAAGEGSISGVVRGSYGYAFPDAVVTLYGPGGSVLATAASGQSGAYEFSSLATGTYRVGFASSSIWTIYLPQFYEHAVDLADATPIVLSADAPHFSGADGLLDLAGYRPETLARDDGSWKTEQLLQCPGTVVALSGDTLAVGGGGTRGGVNACGLVSICRRSATGWSLRQVIDTPAPVDYGTFGRAVALDEDTLVISQYTSEKWDQEPGRVFVYALSGSTWRLQKELVASGSAVARQAYGESVAVNGDTVFVGAPYGSVDGAEGAGAVFVFRRTGASWTQLETLTAGSRSSSSALFGAELATDGSTLFVGAPREATSAGDEAGAVHVFKLRDGRWGRDDLLHAADARIADRFGGTLALSGDTLLVSALNKADWGEVQAFARTSSGWQLQDVLDRPDGVGDYFGLRLSLSGDRALVGWPLREDSTTSGGTYYYVRTGAKWHRVAAVGVTENPGQLTVGLGVAIAGRDLIVFCGRDRIRDDGAHVYDVARVYRPYVVEAGASLVVHAADGVLLNDTAPVGESAVTELATEPEHGAVTLAADGSFSYSPAAGFVGTDTFQYRALSSSWTSSPTTVTLSVEDLQAPTVDIDGVARGWVNAPVTVELSATDATEVARIDYRRTMSTRWLHYTAPVTVRAQGASAYRVRASDSFGNVRSGAGFTVRLDSQRPTTRAPYAATCRHDGKLMLRYEVRDARPGAPTADVTIDLFRGRARKGTFRLQNRRVNRLLTVRSTCWLKPGTYRFVVTATDAAGNRQRVTGANRLTVE